ncbi:hypothetical protein AB1046_11310 [Promicromonospora sp. Populi]|uniref:hypothetical protein n=1 Tax=Promicromonospora sp. Populi TaxID=3239420 RepID=UPI0034E20CA5
METVRRFLVLTPVAFGVTLVLSLGYMAIVSGLTPVSDLLSGLGTFLLVTFAVTAVVLIAVLVAVGLFRLLGVRNAWAALGLAFVLVAVVFVLRYVSDEPWRNDDEEWDLLVLYVAAFASIPTWLTYAVGLLVGDLRARTERRVGATA